MTLDRRSFLKGLLGAATVAALAVPEVAEAKAPITSVPEPTTGPFASVDWNTGSISIHGHAVQPGDRILIEYTADPGANGIYEVSAVYDDGRRFTIRRPNGEDVDITDVDYGNILPKMVGERIPVAEITVDGPDSHVSPVIEEFEVRPREVRVVLRPKPPVDESMFKFAPEWEALARAKLNDFLDDVESLL